MTYLVFVAGTLDNTFFSLEEAENRVAEITGKYAWINPEKIHILEKQGLTKSKLDDIINTELRKGNREARNSQVEDVRPDRQRQLSRVAVTIRALQM